MKRAPMIGHFYTLGAMKRIGDRSYIGMLWKVLESNGRAALIIDPWAGKHSFGARPQLVEISEFDWTPADEFAAHMGEESAVNA